MSLLAKHPNQRGVRSNWLYWQASPLLEATIKFQKLCHKRNRYLPLKLPPVTRTSLCLACPPHIDFRHL